MKEFRVVEVIKLPNSLFNKEKEIISNWFNCDDYSIQEMKRLEKRKKDRTKLGILKDWHIEYREV